MSACVRACVRACTCIGWFSWLRMQCPSSLACIKNTRAHIRDLDLEKRLCTHIKYAFLRRICQSMRRRPSRHCWQKAPRWRVKAEGGRLQGGAGAGQRARQEGGGSRGGGGQGSSMKRLLEINSCGALCVYALDARQASKWICCTPVRAICVAACGFA